MADIAQSHDRLIADIDRTETPPGVGAFWWLGQHTFIMKAGGTVFYIDPWLAPWESRQTPPLLSQGEVTNADWALVSHGHDDHLCPETLPYIVKSSPQARFISPRVEAERMVAAGVPRDRLLPLTADEQVCADGVRITAVKSKHEFFDEDPRLGFPFLGYVIEVGGVTVYHSGDCILYEGLLSRLRNWPRLDVMFLPINGRDAERFLSGCLGNFTYQEAAELAGELRPGLVVPAHYDMFIGNQEDPSRFVRFLEAKYPGVASWVGKPGERVVFGAPR